MSTGCWLDVANNKLICEVAERCVVTLKDPAPRDYEDPCDLVSKYEDPKRVEIWLPEYVVVKLMEEGVEIIGTAKLGESAEGGSLAERKAGGDLHGISKV